MPIRVFAAVALVALASSAPAQQPMPTAYDSNQDKQIQQLKTDLAGLQKSVQSQSAELTAQLETLKKTVEAQTTQIQSLLDAVKEQSTQIQTLNGRFSDLTDVVQNEHAKILADIARDDGGRYVPKLNAAMERESFRKEMDGAVHNALKPVGAFHVVNKTASDQWIFVNRTEYFLRPGEEVKIEPLPVGTVTTQLPGQPIVNWTLAHVENGRYFESIEIVPSRSRRFVEYPLSWGQSIVGGPSSSVILDGR